MASQLEFCLTVSPPAATEWSRLLLHDVSCSERVTMHFQLGGNLSMVTLTFDLDIQTRPSEGPNTSSLWIWRKSVQHFRRYFIHEQKKSQAVPKTKPSAVQFNPETFLMSPASSHSAFQRVRCHHPQKSYLAHWLVPWRQPPPPNEPWWSQLRWQSSAVAFLQFSAVFPPPLWRRLMHERPAPQHHTQEPPITWSRLLIPRGKVRVGAAVGMYRIVNFTIWSEPDSTKVASQAQ